MNKAFKIFLSIIGGCAVLMDILTPIAVALIWSALFGLSSFTAKILFIIGGLASLFKAIKIGWLD